MSEMFREDYAPHAIAFSSDPVLPVRSRRCTPARSAARRSARSSAMDRRSRSPRVAPRPIGRFGMADERAARARLRIAVDDPTAASWCGRRSGTRVPRIQWAAGRFGVGAADKPIRDRASPRRRPASPRRRFRRRRLPPGRWPGGSHRDRVRWRPESRCQTSRR